MLVVNAIKTAAIAFAVVTEALVGPPFRRKCNSKDIEVRKEWYAQALNVSPST